MLHVTGYSPTHQGSLQGRAKTSAVEADGRDVVWGWSQRDFWLCKPPEVVRGVVCHPSAVQPPPPAALTPTIHNLCADQTSEKRKHRVVFMPLVATSPACVFFSGALSKSSQSPRPYKSAPRAALCENTGDWARAPRSAVNFPANKVNIDSDISTCPRVTTITF